MSALTPESLATILTSDGFRAVNGYVSTNPAADAEFLLRDSQSGHSWWRHINTVGRLSADEAWQEAHAGTASAATLRDHEAAIRQAEALGATAAQREKLRTLVTEHRDATRALAQAEADLADARAQLMTGERGPWDGVDFSGFADERLGGVWLGINAYVHTEGNDGYWSRLADSNVVPYTYQLARYRNAIVPVTPSLVENESFREILTAVAQASVDHSMCPVFDEMCRALGLPDREDLEVGVEREYNVTVTYSGAFTYSGTFSSEDDAREYVEQMSNRDLFSFVDIYDAEFEVTDVEEA